jgi:hypothetical protein
MEIHHHEPLSPNHNRPNQNSQNRTTHQTGHQLEECPSIQISQSTHKKSQTISPTTILPQYPKNHRTDGKTKRHQSLPPPLHCFPRHCNLYTNIPIKDTRNIISNTLKEPLINPITRKELLKWYDVITHKPTSPVIMTS